MTIPVNDKDDRRKGGENTSFDLLIILDHIHEMMKLTSLIKQ